MTSTRPALPTAFGGVILAALLLSGCASPPASGGGATQAPPSQTDLVTTPGPVTVLDDGTGAELCLGAIATSMPPQCGGASIIGWDWADWAGSFTEAGGVRWGAFTLTGTYDAAAATFIPADITPWHEGDESTTDAWGSEVDFSTPCVTPDGGWQVLDAARTTDETMNLAFERAAELPGYAASWVDRSRVPELDADATPEEELAATAPFPELTVINVTVVGDVVAAEASLREVWGGMLCVSAAERTDAELQAIAAELFTADAFESGILGGGANGMTGQVDVQVVYDDHGALQQRMDEEYGAGVVVVSSTLQPVN